MQFVWGKILAGEIQKPGSFSFRTLEIVRNLSRQEAETFQAIVPLVLMHDSNCFIYRDAVMHRKFECTFSHILTADECGLVKADGFLFIPFDVSDTCSHLLKNGDYSIIIQTINNEPTSVELNVIPLTQAGCELFSVLKHTGIKEYCEEIANYIQSKYQASISVSIQEEEASND